MSLHVNAPTGLGEVAEQHLHATWETHDGVLVDTMRNGFPAIMRPQYAPPDLRAHDLDTMTPDVYHLLVAALSAWKTYAQSRISDTDSCILECDNEMKILIPSIKIGIREYAKASGTPKPAEKALDDMVLTNPRYIELLHRKQVLVQTRKAIEPHFDRYGRELRILSRTLEMRGQELATAGRGDARGPRRSDFE